MKYLAVLSIPCCYSGKLHIYRLPVSRRCAKNGVCFFFNFPALYEQSLCKGMKTVLVTDNTNQTPPTHFGWKKMSRFNTVKIFMNVHKIDGAYFQCVNALCKV